MVAFHRCPNRPDYLDFNTVQIQVFRTSHTPEQAPDAEPGPTFKAFNISVPVDHFQDNPQYAPHSNATFQLRYWYDAQYYKPGGPVILLASGETGGEDRFPYLQKGIAHQLAKATNGVGVILEHRYYGKSFPTSDLTTESLRFLTTEQSLADTAFFAKNVVFEGLENSDLTAKSTPWIAYGGSYAGGYVAFLRTLYPDVFWGAISSSGVTEAIIDYWQYWEPIRIYGPPACIEATQEFVRFEDAILTGKNHSLIQSLKSTFGLSNITDDTDFASALVTYGIGGWQGRNWDPEVNDPTFSEYCGNITSDKLLYSWTISLEPALVDLIEASGETDFSSNFTTHLLNLVGYANGTLVISCLESNSTLDKCYGTHNSTYYHQTDIKQQWRSWAYQYCTQWGYFQTGSGIPEYIPAIVSRTIDVEYSSIICREAFNITSPPDVEAINKYGGFDISYPHLAFIDGEQDPWRWAGVHAPRARPRLSTWKRPFILIEGAVHHWDENGLFPNETTNALPPAPVKEAQETETAFVKRWLKGMTALLGAL
ncbi:serine carboxypeptidase S28 [Trichodelitschia bisporula]|uniref:Serine carboxypeptidase S28 n=1 Tax=Trichodelitschia bisporula TaxID=703511 RepID=A0A6G1I7V9_9PEZI|nr:serine carboxypeptidase S28 [Trichodelitschia bisporula]